MNLDATLPPTETSADRFLIDNDGAMNWLLCKLANIDAHTARECAIAIRARRPDIGEPAAAEPT